jgi:hypothetical protein
MGRVKSHWIPADGKNDESRGYVAVIAWNLSSLVPAGGIAPKLFQLRVLGVGLLQDGNIRVGVFPQR